MNSSIKSHRLRTYCLLGAFLCGWNAESVCGADGVWTNTSSGVWSDTTKWADGIIAGEGGTATFKAASGTYYITNDIGTVTLSGLNANTESSDDSTAAVWMLCDGTNELVSPAVIYTRAHSLSAVNTTLAGDTDIVITGRGYFFLGGDNLYTGRTIVSNGNARVARDSGFGPAPATLTADAIILDGGAWVNDGNSFVLTNHPNRGITLTTNGGFIAAAYVNAGVQVDSPITGPGQLGIDYEFSPVILNNPNNDYSGGTVVGTNGVGANAGCSPTLRLGQDEVLPDGAGKGGLSINPLSGYNDSLPVSTLDLAGKTETVNTLFSGPKGKITSSVANAGRLIIGGLNDDSDFRGTLTGGATIEKQGTGNLFLTGATLSDGTVDIKEGAVIAGGPNLAAGGTVLLDGGDLTLTAPSGLYEFKGTGGNAPDLSAALTYTGWQLWPVKGSTTSTTTFPNNTQYVYRGKWHVPEAGTYSFAKGFDDGAYLAIDGVTVISNAAAGTRLVVNDVAIDAGWHTLELRYSQGTSSVGPQFSFRNGLLYDSQNGGFTNSTELARARMFTDDGGTNLVADGHENVLSSRILLARNATLIVDPGTGNLVFAGNLTTNGAADPEPVLTVSNSGTPLLFGSSSSSGTPAVLDAAVESTGGIVFTNLVWLRRLPSGTYDIASGADLALDGTALLGGPLNLTDYSIRVVSNDSIGGDGSATANTGTAVWFDTMRYVDQTLTDASSGTTAYDNDIILSGGAVGFTGAGTITYSGALTGTGSAVKSGSGDLTLTADTSTFSGEIRIDAGRLLPADESALRGASVRLNGGRLTNPEGGDLTLDTTPITAVTGGFEVTAAGETMTVNSQITGLNPVSKWGDGTLVIGGTTPNTDLFMHVRGGVVELNKSGTATDYAIRTLIGVEPDCTVRLTGSNGNQIGESATLSGGTLDLNGFSETIGMLSNTVASSTITNGGTAAATLTVGDGDANSRFSGLLTDGAGTLALTKTGAGTLTLSSVSIAYSGGTQVEGGTLRISKPQPLTEGLVYWLDATDTSTLSLSNGFVVSWADSSSNGVNFSQASAAYRPSYVTDSINGLPAVRFGSGNRTRLAASKSATVQTVFVVCRMTSCNALDGLWGYSLNDKGIRAKNLTNWQHTTTGANGDDFTYLGEMYINGVAGTSFTAQEPHILTAVHTNAVTWATAIGDYWFNSTYARYFKGEIGEILVYNTKLGDEERAAVEEYLNAKWFGGISLALNQTVSVAADAQLAVDNFNLGLTALTGGGTLVPEGLSTVTLSEYASFTGTVSGVGTVALADSAGTDARFVPSGFETIVRNDGAQPAVLRVENTGEEIFSGVLEDGTSTLGLTQSGTGTTYYSGTNSTYTGATRIEAGTATVTDGCFAKFIRFLPSAMRPGSASSPDYYGTGYQLSEFKLTQGGSVLPYPDGTLATCPGKAAGAEGPEKAVDGSVDTKFYMNSSSPIYPLVIELPEETLFNGYCWYTANDAYGRDPVAWTVEISEDGSTWTVVDEQDYSQDTTQITTDRKALVGTWQLGSIAVMNIFSDHSPTTVAAPGVLSVSSTHETVGALSGDGTVCLVANGTLGVNAFIDTTFTGGITGTGTVVKTGTEKQSLSGALSVKGEFIVEAGTLDLTGATLTGVTNIIIRTGGELTGTATVNGDLKVTFDGGVYSASLDISGALTVAGTVNLGMAEGATYPYNGLLFNFASVDTATQSALLNAVKPSPIPSGHAAFVRVTDTSARLVIAPVGTLIYVQ